MNRRAFLQLAAVALAAPLVKPVADALLAVAPAGVTSPTIGTFGPVPLVASTMQWNDCMMEDSIAPYLPMMREQVARSAATHMDMMLLQNPERYGWGCDATPTQGVARRRHTSGWRRVGAAWHNLRKTVCVAGSGAA